MAGNGARALWYAIALCVLAIGFFGFSLIVQFHQQNRIDHVAGTTHDALCTFKRDLARRANETEVFIDELQRGRRPMIPGISIADLQRSLHGQRSALASLKALHCSEGG